MWKSTKNWKPARFGGSGAVAVEKEISIQNAEGKTVQTKLFGLAKQRSAPNEKLASDLAQLAGIAVPKVELDDVEGKSGLWAISIAHGETSIDATLLRAHLKEDFHTPKVQDSFKKAAGLLPFYAWIATTDLKDDHLCVASISGGSYHVVGVDFEMSFKWQAADGGPVGDPGMPPSMRSNIDKSVVDDAISAIENVTDAQITEAVNKLPESLKTSAEKTLLTSGLIARRSKVRQAMKKLGWAN